MAKKDGDTNLQVLNKRSGEGSPLDLRFKKLRTGDSISSVDSLVITKQDKVAGSTNVTAGTPVISGDIVQARYSGGTDQENYRVTCTITTANGHTLEGEGMLYVRDDYDP